MFFVRNNCTCVYMLLVFIYSASDVQKCFLVLLLVHRHDKHYCSTWIFPAWMASIENPNISMYSLLRYQPNWKGLHVQSMMLICDIILPLHSSRWGSVVTNCCFKVQLLDLTQLKHLAVSMQWLHCFFGIFLGLLSLITILIFIFAVKKHNFPPPHCQRKLHTAGIH